MREEDDIIGDYTAIKIRTNENMYYTFMRLFWDELKTSEDCKTFANVQQFARYLARDKIQDIVSDTSNTLLYLYPEDKAINRNDIKEIYIDECRHLVPTNN